MKRTNMSILTALPDWGTYILAFVAMAVLDFLWAVYTKKVTDGKAIAAASYASVLMVLNATVVMSFVKDAAILIPAALGAFVGTYLAVWWDNRK